MTWEWSSRSGVYVQVGSYFFCVLLLELQHHFATFLWSFELGTVRLRTLYILATTLKGRELKSILT